MMTPRETLRAGFLIVVVWAVVVAAVLVLIWRWLETP
jgi:hypothetical protein